MPNFSFTYVPENLALGDKPSWVSATDGDTPTVELPVRMLGMDAPELHYQGANENNPGKYDALISSFLTSTKGKQLDAGLRDHLARRVLAKASTRQISAGKAASEHFQKIVKERLDRGIGKNGKPLKPRNLFVMVSQEVFDRFGRLLAYVNASYTKKERNTLPAARRPTFNLQMVQDGQAVGLIIYPNLPKALDLRLLQAAVKNARSAGKGMWGDAPRTLLAYEFRWIVDTILGTREGPDRYCADIETGELFPHQQYYRVLPENRIFFYDKHLGEALKLGLQLVS